jgi:hypothetical protein
MGENEKNSLYTTFFLSGVIASPRFFFCGRSNPGFLFWFIILKIKTKPGLPRRENHAPRNDVREKKCRVQSKKSWK